MAKRQGARLVIVNRDPTDFDDVADLVVRDDIGTLLAPFIDATAPSTENAFVPVARGAKG
jgi:NAD-dependent SIR2 family protein deacetylase